MHPETAADPTSKFALQHTLPMLQALTESATDALFVKDRDGRYLFCNRAGAALVGRPPSEIILQDDVALFGEEAACVIQPQDRRVMESGIAETDEQVLRTPQWLKVFETTESPYRDIHGRIIGVVGVAHEITERKQAEQGLRRQQDLLREANQQFTSIFKTVGDVVFLIAVEHDGFRFQSINPAFARSTGIPAEAVLGKRIEEVIPEPSRQLVQQNYHRAIRENRVVRWEETTTYPNGTLVAEVSIAPVFSPDGICRQLVGSVHEITERKRAEIALKESEERLRLALQAAGSIAFVWDVIKDEITCYYSTEPALPENLDNPESYLQVRERIHPEDRSAFDDSVAACLRSGTEHRHLFRVIRSSGEVVWLDVWGILQRDADGTPVRLNGFGIDVTLQKQAEAELRRTKDLLQALIDGTTDAVYVKDIEGRQAGRSRDPRERTRRHRLLRQCDRRIAPGQSGWNHPACEQGRTGSAGLYGRRLCRAPHPRIP